MTDKMQGSYNEVFKHGQTHEDYILELFRALLTGKTDVFHGFVTHEQDKYETGKDMISTIINFFLSLGRLILYPYKTSQPYTCLLISHS